MTAGEERMVAVLRVLHREEVPLRVAEIARWSENPVLTPVRVRSALDCLARMGRVCRNDGGSWLPSRASTARSSCSGCNTEGWGRNGPFTEHSRTSGSTANGSSSLGTCASTSASWTMSAIT